MPRYKAIAALSENGVIGDNGRIPWHFPEDFKWFKKATMGDHLLFGRKTHESIGRPLPGRRTFVLSRSAGDLPGVTIVRDPAEMDRLPDTETVWVGGGADIYRLFLPRCDELYLTRVHRVIEGDTKFPPFADAFEKDRVLRETPDFTIEQWGRR